MKPPIRLVQIGLGPLGQMLTPYLQERSNLKITGAVDIDPNKTGKDLGTLCGLPSPMGVPIATSLDGALTGKPDVAVITTVSELEKLVPLLEQAIRHNLHVVSTCEELSYPWQTHPDLSQKIDDLARQHNVSVLGTGINPGYLMDFLPTAATAVCRNVQKLRIERIQDATLRRLPFRQKIGAGLSVEEFNQRVATQKIRHVGLTESMHMVAARLGWTLDRTEDLVEPIIAHSKLSGEGWTIATGQASGVNQIGRGFIKDQEVLTLIFRAAVGEAAPHDRVHISGTPEVDLTIAGGINGDVGTCAIVTNAIPTVLNAQPGLRTMVDIAPISCSA
ncbi:MAG: dihydrodipicolinate reductase [bacterium]|nr:dihydrodipicolinate reductase [bacterium]